MLGWRLLNYSKWFAAVVPFCNSLPVHPPRTQRWVRNSSSKWVWAHRRVFYLSTVFPHTRSRTVNEASWEKRVRFCQYTRSIFFFWTSAMGLLMVTEHMVRLICLELHNKCVALSMKMQIASSMCSVPTSEMISSFFNLFEQGQVKLSHDEFGWAPPSCLVTTWACVGPVLDGVQCAKASGVREVPTCAHGVAFTTSPCCLESS